MPQLVNQLCALCQERIESDLDGEFCLLCGAPVHHHCKGPAGRLSGPHTCTACGSEVTDQAAVQERLRQQDAAFAQRARQREFREVDERWGESRARARSQAGFGAVLLLLGAVSTIFSIVSNSPYVVIAWGPILFGLILLGRGLSKLWHS